MTALSVPVRGNERPMLSRSKGQRQSRTRGFTAIHHRNVVVFGPATMRGWMALQVIREAGVKREKLVGAHVSYTRFASNARSF